MLIDHRSGFYKIDLATKYAAEANKHDEDGWQYVVADCGNGLGRIDVYDEDGELVTKAVIF